jgi:spermidine synthase
MRSPPRVVPVAALLFGSGLCALVYQVVWLRELRLVFGASTAASAAVLAVFMGGLGAGGVVFGKRADARRDPLALYGRLELFIALASAITPLFVWLARRAYAGLGGTIVLGMGLGTVVRLVLALLILGLPTFLMGGTLPAAARAAVRADDVGRSHLAWLYGINTLGAVTGATITNFLLLEVFGTRLTLFLACLANALVALFALVLARGFLAEDRAEERAQERARAEAEASAATHDAEASADDEDGAEVEASAEPGDGAEPDASEPPVRQPAHAARARLEPASPAASAAAAEEADHPAAPASFTLLAAGLVGFAFLLMELVWYRMLGPILGGSSYTFGLILAVALLGIGAGGVLYATFGKGRPATLTAFAMTCALEALFIALPYALGDRVALFALLLRPLGSVGFYGHVLGWTLVTSLVVLPAAIVSGYQFPLLIALLGRGKASVGVHVGRAYAANTVGAIVGSLAGGFGLIPLLSAPGCWRLVVATLVGLGLAALLTHARREGLGLRLAPAALVAALGVALLTARGPTAAWRHSPIGAGRADRQVKSFTVNGLRDWMNEQRRTLYWEEDGLESSVAVNDAGSFAFIVNGKSDGSARQDAGTQVMSGLLGALVFGGDTGREAKSVMVVGLGTGSTAGWLAKVPSIERVQVVELEPAIVRVARDCAPVNENVLENPKVKTFIGDAREVLLTVPETYDIVFSEPSNPYRAGVCSMYTRDYYQAIAERLTDDGMLIQWMQAYETDADAVRLIYTTLSSVYGSIETWSTQPGDVIFVASKKPIRHSADLLRKRLAEEPYRSAVRNVWRVDDLEGVLARYVARPSLARRVAAIDPKFVNTDDVNLLEFAFARNVGRAGMFSLRELERAAADHDEHRPEITGRVDWELVEERRAAAPLLLPAPPVMRATLGRDAQTRLFALMRAMSGDSKGALEAWAQQPKPPSTPLELSFMANAHALAGSQDAPALVETMRATWPGEADIVLARFYAAKGQGALAAKALASGFDGYRRDPWGSILVLGAGLELAADLARRAPGDGAALFSALREPFSVHLLDAERRRARVRVARRADFPGLCVEAIGALEPDPPWNEGFLMQRVQCYELAGDARLERAKADLDELRRHLGPPFMGSQEGREPSPDDKARQEE